jgi:predicted nucleic acid-binding Zn ribbon protein
MRRRAPATMSEVLREAVSHAAPDTVLAHVQAVWPEVAGAAIAAEASPSAEREGTVTIECSGSVWAQELTLLAPDLVARLNAALKGPRVRSLRFTVTAP